MALQPADHPSNAAPSAPTYPKRFTGQLPAAPELELAKALEQWQRLYHAKHENIALRIELLQQGGICYSDSKFRELCDNLGTRLNQWLDTPEFRSVDRILRNELARSDNAQIIIETNDTQLQKIPWHLWNIFEEYPNVELSFSTGNWKALPAQPLALEQPLASTQPISDQSASEYSRILVTLGHQNGLDLTTDLKALNHLSEASLTVLTAPSLNQLHESLWQPQGWDIFFFAGHSKTEKNIGVIALNEQEQLTIGQLKHTLGRAIDRGLKIAIFNSCDGLGLAQQLSDLQIPYVVVMREPVPDEVAQQFVHYLLAAFAAGAPFHLAFREARQRLTGLDNDIPGASWLPIIWQNPTAPAVYWKDLQPLARSPVLPKQARRRSLLLKSLLSGGIVLTMRALGALAGLELAAYDHLMRQRPTEAIDPRIVTVEISEDVTSTYGYPLPDEILTTLIEKITQGDPLAIGLDIHRAQPRPSYDLALVENSSTPAEKLATTETGYAKFLQQIDNNPNLFLVCSYGSRDKNYQVPQQLPEQLRNEQVGFSDVPIDTAVGKMNSLSSDRTLPEGNAGLTGIKTGAVVRRHLLSYDPAFSPTRFTCTTPYSLSFQLAYQYLYEKGITPLAVTEDQHWQFGNVVFKSLPQRFGGYQNLEISSSQILLNYRGKQPAQTISYEQLFADDFDPQILQDRVVLMGYTAPIAKDYLETPYGPMPGLWVHAHMVSQLIGAVLDDRPLIQALPQWRNLQWGDLLWILAWSGLGGYAGWASKRPLHWLLFVSAIALLLYGACWLALVYGLWLPLVPSLLAAVGSAIGVRLSAENQRLKPSDPVHPINPAKHT
ncbi:MAG: CHASE2 domain-containing protein [Cyanobacteria bacterium J06598_3]